MKKVRIIPRIDVKSTRVVKGIFYEGWRDIGDPASFAGNYYLDGADEILYLDIFASLTRRAPLFEVTRAISQQIYVPLTIGGGIRSLDDINKALRAGADKVAINTYAVQKPSIIRDASRKFGSQCIVLSIEAKRKPCGYEAYVDHGRNVTGLNAVEWAKQAEELGAGEILISSVDQDGTFRGFDLELVKLIREQVSLPIIVGSGGGSMEHITHAIKSGADAVAIASMLHYGKASVKGVKDYLIDRGVPVRI